MTSYNLIKTPMGGLLLVANQSKLTGVYFAGRDHVPAALETATLAPRHPVLQRTEKQLREFFDGKRTGFSIPIQFTGTEFQERIWKEIARIPYGKTISYSELARRAGKPRAIRPAGMNTGRNPVSIIVPCHRVVGKHGAITGYAGGLDWKRHLLALEKKVSG